MVAHRLWLLLFAACCVARTFPNVHSQLNRRQEPSTTESAAPASSTKCGEIIDAVNSPENYYIFRASVAYACLASVPFNPAVATRFLKYWNETIQFQSTLAYLKNPPEGYQQPPVDVAQELADIQQRINEGFYTNQYAFEADFQLLTYAMHDAHVALTAGVLASFSFASPYEIVSVSIDGKQAPKIYLKDDVIESQKNGSTPSAISAINGEDPVEFLTKYAALNSWGFVEPHAEWNALMSSPTLDIQGGLSIFSGGGTFYPGANLTFAFEGGKEPIETIWVAIYNDHANHTGPLTTGGDFYNYFVLGLLPDSFNASLIVPPDMGDSNTTEAAGNWYEASSGAFPKSPSIVQPGLDILDHGYVSGYFYNDSSIGVLSLPSFDSIPESMDEYLDAVKEFIVEAHGTGLDRVVIDLQSNSGGATLFAYSIFKLFFPDLMPFGGSRRRIFPMANMLGSATTGVWEGLDETDSHQFEVKQETAASEWIITNRLNAEAGRNFTSWEEYQGPRSYNGDFFSLTEQYDLANPTWARSAFDNWPPTMYMPDKSKWPIIERAWNPDQIVLLTDGLCSSACALLVEMMTQAGVRTVVAGGRPSSGPMQAASGNRGASVYSSYEVDDDMDSLRMQDYLAEEDVNATIPEVRETGMHIKHSTFNLRDQIRQNDSVPLQFKYEPADCRIYYTLANMYNMTRLWHDVVAAIFDDQSLCVEGSTGFSATNNTNPKPPPKPQTSRPTISQDNPTVEHVEFEDDPTGGLRNGRGEPRGGNIIELCNNDGSCNNPQSQCRSININCPNSAVLPIRACLPYCTNREGSTACPGTCEMSKTQESKGKVHGHTGAGYTGNPLLGGLCYPKTGNKKLGCPTNP